MLEIRRKLPAGFKYSEIFTTAHHWWMLTQKSSWKMAVRENNLESWSHRQCHEAWALQDLRKWGLFVLNVLTASWVDALRDICALVEDVHNPSRQGSYQTLITTQVTGENRQNQVWLQEEREEGTIKNKWMLFPEDGQQPPGLAGRALACKGERQLCGTQLGCHGHRGWRLGYVDLPWGRWDYGQVKSSWVEMPV